ncbi:tubulin polyglutamylase complex subunit 2-like isoform X1 [Mercenaria mercenaria]|uniref:tubulin polyglutamylase complex subunit 2-like isoform X1 n=1 Tax=Mercenaria mercenaria TaxID=6596 RepID=UPI00234F4297|nr:tubulin polyglutamylase complex subunit 2-like isoform X1 [Mercenaria mercenaria]
MEEPSKTKSLFEQMNVGVLKYLENKTGVCKLELEPRRPADRPSILAWEQKNTVFLPEDLKSFYLTSDGFLLTWCVKIENGPVPVGRMYLNSVSKMMKFGGPANNTLVNPSLADLDADSDAEDETSGTEKPTFDSRCKIFELDPCDGYGKVCLVYKENKTAPDYKKSADIVSKVYTSDYMTYGGTDPKIEVWFLDRALRWHYIADSFTAYYRLMIMHLGLPQWQYAFTDIGLCQQAKQWFNMYAPLRLELDAELGMPGIIRSESNTSTTQIDVGKVFKGKSDKKKPVPAQTQSQQSQSLRKKPTVASAKVGQPPGLKSSGSSSQLAGKK